MRVKAPITDSPWFWVALFSLVGIAALAAISGQYGKRQSRLERQYQARERLLEDAVDDPSRQGYSSAGNTLIAIWPLAVLLAAVASGALYMLRRERRQLCEVASNEAAESSGDGTAP